MSAQRRSRVGKPQLDGLDVVLDRLANYSRLTVGRPLHPYQLEAGAAIFAAVQARDARAISVMMSRQAGKNELSAQLEAYVLTLRARSGGSIVKASPTFKPQAINSLLRLKEILHNPLEVLDPTESSWGYIVARGGARAFFLSAAPDAAVVGATASLMLEVDEAQDVDPLKHDRDLAPMPASTAAPRIYYGTAGTDDDLLQRIKSANLELERRDGIRRHFEYPWHVVAEHNPAYGLHVEAEIARLGAIHPTILSQYELKPVAPRGALLSEPQLRLLQGDHPRQSEPIPGRLYVAGVDVAGPAESLDDEASPSRVDSTVVTIAEVIRSRQSEPSSRHFEPSPCHSEGSEESSQPSSGSSPSAAAAASSGPGPLALVVDTVRLTGQTHLAQLDILTTLLGQTWPIRSTSFDSTGPGQAPYELLRSRLGSKVKPFVFTASSKSDLGYALLAAVNTGRLKMWAAGPDDLDAALFWAQARAVRRDMHPSARLSWSNPRGHDDCVTSLALALHAAEHLAPPPAAAMLRPPDPFPDDRSYY